MSGLNEFWVHYIGFERIQPKSLPVQQVKNKFEIALRRSDINFRLYDKALTRLDGSNDIGNLILQIRSVKVEGSNLYTISLSIDVLYGTYIFSNETIVNIYNSDEIFVASEPILHEVTIRISESLFDQFVNDFLASRKLQTKTSIDETKNKSSGGYPLVASTESQNSNSTKFEKGAHKAYNDILHSDSFNILYESYDSVHLLGIDAPNPHFKEYCGQEAAVFLMSLVGDKNVFLEVGDEKKNEYGNWEAYVYLSKDKAPVNALMIRSGYADIDFSRLHTKYHDVYRALREKAQDEGLGIWGTDTCEAVK